MSSSPIARRVLIGNMTTMQANNQNINQGEVGGHNNRGEYHSNAAHSGNVNSAHMEHTNAVDDDVDYESITLGHFSKVPALNHHSVISMYSEPALTQQEYQDVATTKQQAEALGTTMNEYVNWDHCDEIIAVTCRNEPTSTTYRFEIMKSALERSPVLAEFFKSSSYLYGCGMMLTFPEDLAICFHAVKEYLEKGPDIYNEATLKTYATVRNAALGGATVESFTFLVRLHKLATKLGLRGLAEMALVVLHQIEMSMTPQSCNALAGLVFKDEPIGSQDIVKAFVIKHVGNHFDHLHHSHEWNHVVATTSNDFQVKWAKMVIAHHQHSVPNNTIPTAEAILGQFANTNTGLAQLITEAGKAEVLRRLGLNQPNKRPKRQRSARSSIDTTVTAVRDSIEEDSNEEEDPVTPRASETIGAVTDTIPNAILERTSLSRDYRRPFWQADAKARRTLGMNNDGGGKIAGRIRPSGLSKARKSFNDFMRAS